MGDQFSEWDWFWRAYEKSPDAKKAMKLYKRWRTKADKRKRRRLITARKRALSSSTRAK